MCAVIGVLLLLAPRGVPVRWFGLLLLLPLLWPPENKLESQQVQLTLLDVGQGLAMVVRTARHVLVYDTGPRFNDSFDTGRLVLVPYLRQMGINHIDTLIVSHGDMDHRGGVETLLEEIPVQRVLTSMTDANLDVANEACVNGQQWQWDGVEFLMLHPGPADGASSENNRSCVLRISAGASRALLPGDIQEAAERELLRRDAGRLAADILVAPHHGSRTSSTENFIDAVKPRLVLFAVGYRNRFGFPKAEVVERYRRRQVTMLNSAEHGAITLLLDPQRGVELIDTHRRSASRYWNSRAGHSNPVEF
jgi:competence protein ComEC